MKTNSYFNFTLFFYLAQFSYNIFLMICFLILSDENDQNNTKLETILNKIQNIKTLLNETNTQPQGVVDDSTFSNLFTMKNIMPVVTTIVFYGILYYFWDGSLYHEMYFQLKEHLNGHHKDVTNILCTLHPEIDATWLKLRPTVIEKADVASGPDLPNL